MKSQIGANDSKFVYFSVSCHELLSNDNDDDDDDMVIKMMNLNSSK